ncbi:MAG: hypothetical protein IJ837_02135 [Clostridia bacterium]|nr:hypothetical protein [Clostridia bacterium]
MEKLDFGETKFFKLGNFSDGIKCDENNLIFPTNFAKSSYNFSFLNGSLKTGLGFKNFVINYTIFGLNRQKTMTIPQNVVDIEKLWFFKKWDANQTNYLYYLIIYTLNEDDSKSIFWAPIESTIDIFLENTRMSFTKAPIIKIVRIGGVEYFLLVPTHKGDYMYLWDGEDVFSYPEFSNVSDFEVFNGRYFGLTKDDNQQIYLTTRDLSSWLNGLVEGQTISLLNERGPLNKIIAYGTTLYLIRDYGITALTPAEQIEDFKIKDLSKTSAKIYGETAVLCGDKILMLCDDGLYAFDGIDMEKLNLGFESLLKDVDNSSSLASFSNGKYYLSFKTTDNSKSNSITLEDNKNNSLLELDINTNKYSLMCGVNVKHMINYFYKTPQKLVALFNSSTTIGELCYNGKIFDVATKKVWESVETDFGSTATKTLKSVTLKCLYPLKLIVYVDDKKYEFNIKNSEKTQKINTNLKGLKFLISFESVNCDAFVSDVCLEVLM